jgi:hypothetical protein
VRNNIKERKKECPSSAAKTTFSAEKTLKQAGWEGRG